MKTLIQHIQEAFRVNKDYKPERYSCHPKDKQELIYILEKRLQEDKNADLNDIDVSKIKDMSVLFFELDPHNIDISEWDVSNVERMEYMFDGCENFNCDLSDWDVSNVEDMHCMFDGCKSFEGEGLKYWKVSKVKDMSYMFGGCNSLKNEPIWYKYNLNNFNEHKR